MSSASQYFIKATAEYKNLLKTGKKQVCRFFVCYYALDVGVKGAGRLGIGISSSIVPKAVDRNRIKRAVKEYFRKNVSINKDCVLLARKGIQNADIQKIYNELSYIFTKVLS